MKPTTKAIISVVLTLCLLLVGLWDTSRRLSQAEREIDRLRLELNACQNDMIETTYLLEVEK